MLFDSLVRNLIKQYVDMTYNVAGHCYIICLFPQFDTICMPRSFNTVLNLELDIINNQSILATDFIYDIFRLNSIFPANQDFFNSYYFDFTDIEYLNGQYSLLKFNGVQNELRTSIQCLYNVPIEQEKKCEYLMNSIPFLCSTVESVKNLYLTLVNSNIKEIFFNDAIIYDLIKRDHKVNSNGFFWQAYGNRGGYFQLKPYGYLRDQFK